MTFHILVGEPRAVARRLRRTPDAVVLNTCFVDDCEGLVVIAKTADNIVAIDQLSYSIKTDTLNNASTYINAIRNENGWLADENVLIKGNGYFLTKGGAKAKFLLEEVVSPEPAPLPDGTKAQILFDAETNLLSLGSLALGTGPVWVTVSESENTRYKFADAAAAVANFSHEVSPETLQPTVIIKTTNYQTNSSLWLDPRVDQSTDVQVYSTRYGFLDTDTGETYDEEADSTGTMNLITGNYQDIKSELDRYDSDPNARIGSVSVLRQDRTEFYVLELVSNNPNGDN